MSIDEAKQQKALALLEHMEAHADYEDIRAEATDLSINLHSAAQFARYMTGAAVASVVPRYATPADLLELNARMKAAAERLRVATEVKKTFGMKP